MVEYGEGGRAGRRCPYPHLVGKHRTGVYRAELCHLRDDGTLTLLTTAFSSSLQASCRVLRMISRCCVMWSSACSSSTGNSCAAFTRVPTTQSVISRQTAGSTLERFLKTSSRQPRQGRLSRGEKTGIHKDSFSQVQNVPSRQKGGLGLAACNYDPGAQEAKTV